jgi:hypothetical protein
MVGFWLCMSPFVFRGTPEIERFQRADLAMGAAVVVLALLSFWRRTAWAHLVTAVLAFGFGVRAYIGFDRPGPPAAQNDLIAALVLVLLAIIPNDCDQPPRPWRQRI